MLLQFSDRFADKNLYTVKMDGSKHIGFKSRLLAVLFLFFNCVCTAAPVIKSSLDGNKQVLSLHLVQNLNNTETEEENRLTISSYINHHAAFSFRKQTNHLVNETNHYNEMLFSVKDWSRPSISAADILPTPRYYSFLFRYKPF